MKKFFLIFAAFAFPILFYFSACNNSESSANTKDKADPQTVAKGEKLFVEKCSGCHNFSLDGIGPQLGGVMNAQPISWIRNFISNPKKVIDAGDTTALDLLHHYKTVMPSFENLSEEEMDQLLAYIQIHKKHIRPPVIEDSNDIKNPIPDSIRTSNLVVAIDSFIQIPASSADMPRTRITKLDYQPGTGDLFVLDLRGKLYRLQNGKPTVYMDMEKLEPKFINQPGLATGFGSFAFHPDFAKNGLIYTTHTEPAASAKADFGYADSIPVVMQWILSEFKTDPNAAVFAGRERELMRIDVPTGIHGAQEITFNHQAKPGNKDYGNLYMGIGDGGSTEIGYPLASAKPLGIWGTIIRIDPSGNNSRNGEYGIPADNPFANNSDHFLPEIYAYGFRNPHRVSWDKSGEMLAVNIGQTNIESVNLILPGHFYGWPIREGTFMEKFFNETGKVYPLPPDDSVYHVTYPVVELDHDESTAITGGFEYRGSSIPLLKGKYLFGDISSGKLFYVDIKDLALGKLAIPRKWNISLDNHVTNLVSLSGRDRVELRFGMDSKGEIYLLTKADGKIYKLAAAHLKH